MTATTPRAPFKIEMTGGYRCQLRDADGAIVARVANYRQAERARDRLEREAAAAAKTTWRPCLCCRNSFPSEGAHNRLCDACRRRDAPAAALAFNTGQRAGRTGRPL